MRERNPGDRLRLAFAFGGKAVEHDLSVKSALYLLAHVDRARFEALSIYVDEAGSLSGFAPAAEKLRRFIREDGDKIFGPKDRVPADFEDWAVSTLPSDRPGEALRLLTCGEVDVVFPVFHGQGGEDGIFQGFLETLGLPYVGCDISGSILGNDKAYNKAVCRNAGIAVADFLVYDRDEWAAADRAALRETERVLGYPVFVKPPCLGSSMGVSKAKDRGELEAAAALAFTYGSRVILERALVGPEYGIGLIGNDRPLVSAIVEFGGCPGFLSYEAKYGPGAFEDRIPALLDPAIEREMRAMAVRIYRLLGLRGMSRLDFFVVDGKPFFGESNTVPGFGRTSVFSKMWEVAGIDLRALIGKLVEFALEGDEAGATSRKPTAGGYGG